MARVRVSLSLPEEVLHRFDELARGAGERRSATITRALQWYLDSLDREARALIDDLSTGADALSDGTSRAELP